MTDKKRQSLERALETAEVLFLNRPYEDVTIAEIAGESRCSTATLYSAYGSKSELYEEVRLKKLHNRWAMPAASGKASLQDLIRYFLDRAKELGDISSLNLLRSATHNSETVPRYVMNTISSESKLSLIVQEVRACMDAGLLKSGNPKSVAYVIYAGCGFEPVTYGLLFGADEHRDPSVMVRTVFSVLTTPAGTRELDKLLPAEVQAPEQGTISLARFLEAADQPRPRNPADRLQGRGQEGAEMETSCH